MKITREYYKRRAYFTVDGEKISRQKLEKRCARFLNWDGLQMLFDTLIEKGECIITLDESKSYLANYMATQAV